MMMIIYIYTNFIEHNRHFLSTYFLLDLFVLPYCFYRIRRELIHVLSIVVCISSTFCSTLGRHQGRIYSLLKVVELSLKCKFVFVITFVNDYGKSIILFVELCRCNHIIFTNPSARAGYDTRSIFKRSLIGLNSEFSFS